MTEDELKSTVIATCNAGRKIEAIKLYREATGKGLAEAKSDVETLAAGGYVSLSLASARAQSARGDMSGVEAALRAGNKIEAIKQYRELTGLGLREAKEAVEAMVVHTHGAPQPPEPQDAPFGASQRAPYEQRPRSGFAESPTSPPSAFPVGLLLLLVLGFVAAGTALLYVTSAP